MPTGVHYDGDSTEPLQSGQPLYKQPFPTDPKTYLYTIPYTQIIDGYLPGVKDVLGPYGGFSTGVDEFYRDEGGGVVSFNREFALTPDSRNEYESFVYPFQVWATGSGGGIQEFPFSVNSRVQYDYFHTDFPGAIDLPRAPRIIDAFNILFPLNGFVLTPDPNDPNPERLAEDSSMRIWKGKIYERKQRFVRVPTIYSFLMDS